MPGQQQTSSIVHERVDFGGKASKAERRSGAGSHRSNMLTEHVQELVDPSKIQKARSAVRPSMRGQQQTSSIVHERVDFGGKASQAERRSGAGSHRSNMLTEHVQELVDPSKVQKARSAVRPSMRGQQQTSSIVHERVDFGGKASQAERRSGAGSHRSNMLTEHAQELVDPSKVQKARSAVRPRQNLNPHPGATED